MANNSSVDKRLPVVITDIGCERDINEDRYAVLDAPNGRIWIVCDGMGGAVGGELAAQLAIDTIRRKLDSVDSDSPSTILQCVIEEANRIIVLRRHNPAFSSMGTTIVAVFIAKGSDDIVVANVGDSRAYLVRDNTITQLTKDHTYVQDLVDRGTITKEDAAVHPQAHVLTSCLGADPRITMDSKTFYLWNADKGVSSDVLLLCSDGLYSLVSDEEIVREINTKMPQEACTRLIEMAKERGGYDNITVMIIPLNGILKENPSIKHRSFTKVYEINDAPKARKVLSPAMKVVVAVLMFFVGIVFAVLTAILIGVL